VRQPSFFRHPEGTSCRSNLPWRPTKTAFGKSPHPSPRAREREREREHERLPHGKISFDTASRPAQDEGVEGRPGWTIHCSRQVKSALMLMSL
jgi:hypothetical protein